MNDEEETSVDFEDVGRATGRELPRRDGEHDAGGQADGQRAVQPHYLDAIKEAWSMMGTRTRVA